MLSTLIIGYGNPSRQDDGVGLAVINGLRALLGLPELDEGDDGFADAGRPLDTLFLQQLTPELAETLAEYERVVFVDAHFGVYEEVVHHTVLEPSVGPALVSHHMKPGMLLALAERLYGHAPQAELISIRGFAFDFTPILSPATAQGVAEVVAELWERFGAQATSSH